MSAALGEFRQTDRGYGRDEIADIAFVDGKVAEIGHDLSRSGAETVDAALQDVIDFTARRALMERIVRDGGIGPSPEELRRLPIRFLSIISYARDED